MRRLKEIMLHISVMCSFACIIAGILDWYNPYMDFSGHLWFMQAALYGSVLIQPIMMRPATGKAGRRRRPA